MMKRENYWTPAGIDISRPSHAYIYDRDIFSKEQKIIRDDVTEWTRPPSYDIRRLAQANQEFFVRAIRVMAESGVSQFINFDLKFLTLFNFGNISSDLQADFVAAYIGYNPGLPDDNLPGLPPGARVIRVSGEFHKIDETLKLPEIMAFVDFKRPMGTLFGILHFVSDAEFPIGIIKCVREYMVSGSYAAISHFSAESDASAQAQLNTINANDTPQVIFRSRLQIATFFDSFRLLDPGLVNVESWRPDLEPIPTRLKLVGAVGLKM